MLLGYNTNGFAHHSIDDALAILAELGYRSVALTIDHGLLNPFAEDLARSVDHVRRLLERFQLRSVIETGARFLLDPWQKHEPTLLSSDPALRARRVAFLRQAIDVAVALGSDCVSLWSGIQRDPDMDEAAALDRLCEGLKPVLEHAHRREMTLGFEPEPGMLIDTMARFERLQQRIRSDRFRLTLDLGHLHCQGEVPIADVIRRWGPMLVNVHIEDMRGGIHEHLQFGAGEMDFLPLVEALRGVDYQGGLHVELSRHSHDAPQAAGFAFDFLSRLLGESSAR